MVSGHANKGYAVSRTALRILSFLWAEFKTVARA